MRLISYDDNGVMGSLGRESMLPDDTSGLAVKISHGTANYFASSVSADIATDASNDMVTASFTNLGVVINAAETITVVIDGVMNPPSTAPLDGFQLTISS